MTNQEKLKRMIEEIVRKEVRAIAPTIIKEVMGQVMGTLISEAKVEDIVFEPSAPTYGNSGKRVALQESIYADEQMAEYPTMGGRTMGRREMDSVPSRKQSNMITIDCAMTDNGTPIPIPQEAVPEAVLKAMNKDYRPMLAMLDKNKNGGF